MTLVKTRRTRSYAREDVVANPGMNSRPMPRSSGSPRSEIGLASRGIRIRAVVMGALGHFRELRPSGPGLKPSLSLLVLPLCLLLVIAINPVNSRSISGAAVEGEGPSTPDNPSYPGLKAETIDIDGTPEAEQPDEEDPKLIGRILVKKAEAGEIPSGLVEEQEGKILEQNEWNRKSKGGEEQVSDSEDAGAVGEGGGVGGELGAPERSNELPLLAPTWASADQEERNGIRRFDVNILPALPEKLRQIEILAESADETKEPGKIEGKSKFKSSTVYLNAEEQRKTLGQEEEKIAQVQIKKLVSIRNDVLETVKHESSEKKARSPEKVRISEMIPIWKAEASLLQQQIHNASFVEKLNEEQAQVLPGIPKFTQQELLDVLKYLVAQKSGGKLESPGDFGKSAELEQRRNLTKSELEIIKCAQQLVSVKERQSLMGNVLECIRGLSVVNCMRIFVWPILVDNLPESVGQNLANLPIEINLIDLFQGNRQKSARAENAFAHPDLMLTHLYNYAPVFPYVYPLPQLPPYAYVFSAPKAEDKDEGISEADGTRSKEPKPESPALRTTINNQDVLTSKASEQIPLAIYSDNKRIECFQQYNYVSCIRYSPYQLGRQTLPSWVPDFASVFDYIPSFAQITGAFASVPSFLPTIPDFSSFIPSIPGLPGAGSASTEAPALLSRQASSFADYKRQQEANILRVLTEVSNSLKKNNLPGAYGELSEPHVIGESVTLDSLTKNQLEMLRLAENMLPPELRTKFARDVVSCIDKLNFIICTRYVGWATLRAHVKNFPEFPYIKPPRLALQAEEEAKNAGVAEERAASSIPVIRVTGTRFVPIFTEQPEAILLNILQSVQLAQSSHLSPGSVKHERLSQLTGQQSSIVGTAESLLPMEKRASFIESMAECVGQNNFLLCARDLVWPAVGEVIPALPSWPNFGTLSDLQDSGKVSAFAVSPTTEASAEALKSGSLSETNVKTTVGQNGDATITITDTRFFPIFHDDPDSVLLSILRAVEISMPHAPHAATFNEARKEEFAKFLTSEQINIIDAATNLLPAYAGQVFLERMIGCVRLDPFLSCMREVTWPTISFFFPRLPHFQNFPNFPSLLKAQNSPRTKTPGEEAVKRVEEIEGTIEKILGDLVPEAKEEKKAKEVEEAGKVGASPVESSKFYESPAILKLTSRERNIIRMVESGLPEHLRAEYLEKMAACLNVESFLFCSERVGWPELKQSFPQIPDFPSYFPGSFSDLFGQLPAIPTPPAIGGGFPFQEVPQFPQFPQIPQVPQIPQIPQIPQVPQLPAGFPTPPDGFPQLPSGFPQFDSFPRVEVALTDEPALFLPSFEGATKSSANTPSVGGSRIVPAYAGQPAANFLDFTGERVHPEDVGQPLASRKLLPLDNQWARGRRSLRETAESRKLHASRNSYSISDTKAKDREPLIVVPLFPALDNPSDSDFENPANITLLTEEKLLELLVKATEEKQASDPPMKRPETPNDLDPSLKTSLSPTQYEILRLIGELGDGASSDRGFMSRLIQCIRSLSFLRCVGIFAWPVISSNLPFPSLPSIPFLPSLPFGRSLQVPDSPVAHDFPVQPLPLQQLRTSRATKIKDNKNLPSILTIISDIMEEVLDQRPDNDKLKKEKDRDRSRRKRSIDSNNNQVNMPYPLVSRLRNEFYENRKDGEMKGAPLQVKKSIVFVGKAFRKKMGQFMPGIAGLLLSFVINLTLAHARTAASVAGMMSNMALGSATISMLRDSLFGSSSSPQIKYVYDNVGTNFDNHPVSSYSAPVYYHA